MNQEKNYKNKYDEIDLWELFILIVKYKIHLIFFTTLGIIVCLSIYKWKVSIPDLQKPRIASTVYLEYNSILEYGLATHQYFPDLDFKGDEIKKAERFFDRNNFSGKGQLKNIVIKDCPSCKALNYPIGEGSFSASAGTGRKNQGGGYIGIQLGGLDISLEGKNSKQVLMNLILFFENRAAKKMIKAIDLRILKIMNINNAKKEKEHQLIKQLEKEKIKIKKELISNELKSIFHERIKLEEDIISNNLKKNLIREGKINFYLTNISTTSKYKKKSLFKYLIFGFIIGIIFGSLSIMIRVMIKKIKQSEQYEAMKVDFINSMHHWKL